MGQWQITGVDRETGERRTLTCTAPDERGAVLVAGSQGIVVERASVKRPWWRTRRGVASVAAGVVLIWIAIAIIRGVWPLSIPDAQTITDRAGLWPSEPVQSVLRGRPLTAIYFTNDASRGWSEPVLALYTDENNKPVAIAANWIEPFENGPVLSHGDELTLLAMGWTPREGPSRQVVRIADALKSVLDDFPITPDAIVQRGDDVRRIVVWPDEDNDHQRTKHLFFKYRGLDCELMLVDVLKEPPANYQQASTDNMHGAILVRQWTWIIRDREW